MCTTTVTYPLTCNYEPLIYSHQSMLGSTCAYLFLGFLWLRSRTRVLLSTRFSSQHSLPQPGTFLLKKALVKTAHSIKIVLHLCFFVTLPPTSLLEYVALLYCHTSSGKVLELGACCTRFLIFWLFSHVTLKLPLQMLHKPRCH